MGDPTAAERMRRFRDRQKRGVIVVEGIEIEPEIYEALIESGLLGEDETSPEVIAEAIESVLIEWKFSVTA